MFRGFATKAKAVVARQFHFKQFKILWRDKIHRSDDGEEAIKDALRSKEKEYLRDGLTDWEFRYALDVFRIGIVKLTVNQGPRT